MASLALLVAFLAGGTVEAMTKGELIGALKRAGAEEAEVLERFPVQIEETRYDFLGEGVYLRVSVEGRHHGHLLHFVAGPKGEVYRLKLGAGELERMRAGLKLAIGDRDRALRYARWVVEVSRGPAVWLVTSVEEVPFQPVGEGEQELAGRIEAARKAVAGRIPAAEARVEREGFVVTLGAVEGRDLVRYAVKVSRAGRYEITKQTLLADLPVVYVLGD